MKPKQSTGKSTGGSSKYTRTIIAVRGDTQGGSSVGLVNPETKIPDIGILENGREVFNGWRTPELRPVQRTLWKWHTEDLENIKKLAGKDRIVFLEMGDMTQGNIFKDNLSEITLSGQYFVSKYNTIPILKIPTVSHLYIVKGTGVHVWGEGSTETMLTYLLKEKFPQKKIDITDHWFLNVDGFQLDVAHHGPGAGIRNWTRGNVFELYIKSILADIIDVGDEVPDAILRGHKHEFIYRRAVHQVKGKIWELPGFIVPPYCFLDSHALKVVNSPSYMGVGMLAFEIINGSLYKFHPFLHYVDLRAHEKV